MPQNLKVKKGEYMKISEEIQDIKNVNEFRVCPSCGYEMGFHVSFLKNEESGNFKIVLICPNCGARFDVGWNSLLSKEVIT